MRVLYVYEGKMRGYGLDAVARQEILGLSEAGIETLLVARGRVELPHVRNRRILLNPAKLLRWNLDAYYGANRRFVSWVAARKLRRERFDLVVAWSRGGLYALRAAFERGIPSLLNSGSAAAYPQLSWDPPLPWPQVSLEEMRSEYEHTTKVLAPSDLSIESYVAQGVEASKVVPVYRGFDTSKFFPSAEQDTTFRVLFCGRVGERKGARQVLAAWDEAQLADAELWFLGEIDPELEDWARTAGRSNVRFLGFQSNVADCMRRCSVQILLSRNEGFCKSLVEGAACGLVTIGTARVGFPILEGETGFVVEREAIGRVAELFRRLHQNRDECRTMGLAAQDHVNRLYTWGHFRKRFLALVAEVTSGR